MLFATDTFSFRSNFNLSETSPKPFVPTKTPPPQQVCTQGYEHAGPRRCVALSPTKRRMSLRGKPSKTFRAATKRPLTKIVNKQSLKHDIRWPKCKPPRAPAQLLNASANPPRQRVAAPTCLRFSNLRSVSQGFHPAPLEGPRKRISMIWCLHCHWQDLPRGASKPRRWRLEPQEVGSGVATKDWVPMDRQNCQCQK